jgi:hypothetical protein
VKHRGEAQNLSPFQETPKNQSGKGPELGWEKQALDPQLRRFLSKTCGNGAINR